MDRFVELVVMGDGSVQLARWRKFGDTWVRGGKTFRYVSWGEFVESASSHIAGLALSWSVWPVFVRVAA